MRASASELQNTEARNRPSSIFTDRTSDCSCLVLFRRQLCRLGKAGRRGATTRSTA